MEAIQTFLPVTVSEIMFLRNALKFYKSSKVAENLKNKVDTVNIYQSDITPELIIQKACKLRGVTIEELRSNSRIRHIVETRQCICRLLKDYFPKIKLVKIGKYINRDHGTVIHGLDVVETVYDVAVIYQGLKSKI